MAPKLPSISELTAAAGASPGRGRGNGTVAAMASSQVARREVKVARVLSRMPTIMAAVSRILRLGPAEYAGPFLFLFWAGDDLQCDMCRRLTPNSLGPIRVPHHDAGHFARRFGAAGFDAAEAVLGLHPTSA